jgi:lysophospholipase L1-like esterase
MNSAPELRCLSGPLITFATLGVVFFALELGARLLLPSPRTVEITNVAPLEAAPEEIKAVEQNSGIDSVFRWGPQGVRLHPNIRATIRNHSLSRQDVTIEVNSLGLRYPELGPRLPEEIRVLVLGDSITIGDYVSAAETYPGFLEAMAERDGRSIRFINAGLPGVSLSAEVYRYMELRDAVKPDLVVVGMYLNDSIDSHVLITEGRHPVLHSFPVLRSSRFLSWIAARTAVAKSEVKQQSPMPELNLDAWREEFRAGRDLKPGDMFNDRASVDFEVYNAYRDFGLAWNPRSWELIARQLRALDEEVSSHGAKLGVFLLPVHFQVKGAVEDFRPQRSFTEMCQRLDISCLDILPALRQEWGVRRQELFYDHCHYRPYGNQVVAAILYPWITALLDAR